jgi:hypothetical protein
MSPFLRNTFSIVVGIIVGSIINLSLLEIGGKLIAPPAGADLSNAEGWKAALPLLQAKHFLFPFLAHAMGTLAGAMAAAHWAVTKMRAAWIVGFVFFIGGIMSCFMIPAPLWFIATDLIMAYLPFAYMAGKYLGKKNK